MSARYRRAKSPAGFGNSFDRFAQLPKVFRLIWIAEVQVVGDGQRFRAGTSEIARGFSNCNFAAFARIEPAIEGIAIGRRGENFIRVTDEEDRSIRSRLHHSAGAHGVIVLAIDPIL